MISPIETALERQLQQLRGQYQRVLAEREVYVRTVACLARTMLAGEGFLSVDDSDGKKHIVIPKEEHDAVPGLYTVEISLNGLVEDGAAEDAEASPMFVVMVRKKEGQNGTLSVPQRPPLQIP